MKFHARRTRIPRAIYPASLLLLLCLATPVSIVAIPLSEYRQNLQRAVTALDTLGQIDESEDSASYERRLTDTVTAVGQLVPENQSVESGSSNWAVDNSWLHKKLDELEAATASERSELRRQIIQSLQTIEERVGELEKSSTAEGLSKDEAGRRLAGILSRPEYGGQNGKGSAITRWLIRFTRWISQFLPRMSPLDPSHGSPLTVLAQFVVVALALAVIIYVIVKLTRLFSKRSRKIKPKKKKEARIVLGERLEPDASATDLLAEAEALARNGEIRAAIRKTYIALLVELGDRKIISLAQNKTNRDYLRSVSNNPSLYGNMRGLTESFERHWYGFAESSPGDWQAFKAGYLAALRTNG